MAKRKKRLVKKAQNFKETEFRTSRSKEIWAFVLNVLPLAPGLGSLLMRKTTIGSLQLVLWFVAQFLIWMTISGYSLGMALAIIVWAWAAVTGLRFTGMSK